jgi:proteic killer suppression protein
LALAGLAQRTSGCTHVGIALAIGRAAGKFFCARAAHAAAGEREETGEGVGAVESLTGINKQIVYNSAMIESFASDETENLFATGKSRRLPPEILKRALMRLTQLHAATEIDDLRMPPSNRLEALVGELAGKWSIRVNDRWRLCFRFEGGHAYEVEIVDYH